MVCEWMGGQRGGGEGVGCCTRLEPAWLGPHGFLEPARWGMLIFLEKNHIDILGDSYANKDKSWGPKPGKKLGRTGTQAMDTLK